MPASAPSWADLPEECRLRVLSFLDTKDRCGTSEELCAFLRVCCIHKTSSTAHSCRLRCRLVGRWWAEAPLRSLSIHVEQGDDAAVTTSVSLMLGRPGLCNSLEAVRLCFESPPLSGEQYAAAIMLLARMAPALRWFSVVDHAPAMDAAALTACTRALSHLVCLRHLHIYPPSPNLAFLSHLPHLHTLHVTSDVDIVFRPPHPLTALRALILVGRLPNLSYLNVYCDSMDEPLLLAPFASSLRTLLLWNTFPSCIALRLLPCLVCKH